MFSAIAMDETIRGMSLDDLGDVLEIEMASFLSPWTKRLFEDTLASPISKGFVMKKGAEIIGYIMLYSVAAEAHILNIAIHPNHRGSGHASALIQYALDHCKENGIRQFFLEVREGNIVAIKLYHRFGFEKIGKRRRYYSETNEDALVMCLSVH